jgi:anti-anti-sigma regulatory factor
VRAWRPVSLLTPDGTLRAAGRIAGELRAGAPGGVVLTDHLFGTLPSHARHLARQLASVGRPWAALGTLALADDPDLLRRARASGCRALLLGPAPDPLGRDQRLGERAAAALRRIRRAGILTVATCALGEPGDDAGIFGRAVWTCTAGRVAFPRLVAADDPRMSRAELEQGLAWARRALLTRRAIWRRSGLVRGGRAVLLANFAHRRDLSAAPAPRATPAMRLARALAQPIRIRERVPFVSTLVGAVHAGGGQVRTAWLRARAARDETIAAVVIRLEGAIDARAARKLVTRVRRAVRGTRERIVIDLGGLEHVSLTVLTRFVEEHAGRLGEVRGRLAFRNLRPAIDAVRRNLHGMLPNAAVLEHALDETV